MDTNAVASLYLKSSAATMVPDVDILIPIINEMISLIQAKCFMILGNEFDLSQNLIVNIVMKN